MPLDATRDVGYPERSASDHKIVMGDKAHRLLTLSGVDVGLYLLCRHASHPQRHDDPSSGTCSYTPISSRSISQSALQSLITCGSAPLSGIDTQRQSLGSAARLWSEFFKPPCSFETNGRHRPRPASAQNPAGRDRRLRFVLSFFGLSQDPLAGWLETAGQSAARPWGTMRVLQLPLSNKPRAFSELI